MSRVPKPTNFQVEAEKAIKPVDAAVLLSEHQLREKAFFENRERLKADRLAREAQSKGNETQKNGVWKGRWHGLCNVFGSGI